MQEENNNTPIQLQDVNETVVKDSDYDFEKYKSIEGFSLDEDLINKFCPIAKKLKLDQSSIELLMELALEMSKRQKSLYEKDDETKLKEKIDGYSKLFNEDTEIPVNNSIQKKEYMKTANSAYTELASPQLKDILKSTGLVCHPELIKMFHKIGELIQEDALSYFNEPVKKQLTPAEILYGSKN